MFKKSYSQKKGDRSRPWYTPGNKREKPVGHDTQLLQVSTANLHARFSTVPTIAR
jgi:hypothetical protein